MNSRVSLQPPYSFSMKQYYRALAQVPLTKDTLTRGQYYINKHMLEDPTSLLGQLTLKSNITEYSETEKMYLDTISTKTYNYSDFDYKALEGVIVDIEFTNGQATTTIKLKQTTRIGDFLSYIGGILTSTLLVFRFITQKFQVFNSDLKVYESLATNTTVFPGDKSSATLEPTLKKSDELPTKGYLKKLQLYLGYFSPLSCIWCCFWNGGTQMKKKIKKIQKIQEIIKDKFDVKKMIIDIASLIYNQRNILNELKMTSPPINFMKEWLNETHEGKEEEERSQNQLLVEGSGIQQQELKTIELFDVNR